MSSSYTNPEHEFEIRSGLGTLLAPATPAGIDPALAIVADPLLGASQANASNDAAPRKEVVFIEDNVGDLDVLLSGIGAGKEVHVLDSKQDGLKQIAEILEGRSGIDALHLISHGKEASVNLGSLLLDQGNLDAHAQELQTIGHSLSKDADVLLYGCNIGVGSKGNAFVDQLAVFTGADVAASNDKTGAAALGGDWDLEVHSGKVEAPLVVDAGVAAHYQSVLALSNVTLTFSSNTAPNSGWFVSRGVYTDPNVDMVYNVQGNSAYQLTVNGASWGVEAYASSELLWLAAGADETQVVFSFAGGKTFTPSSIGLVRSYNNPNLAQTIVFKGYDSGGLVATQSLSFAATGSPVDHSITFSGFTNITSLKITASTNSNKIKWLGLDNMVFSDIGGGDTTPPTVSGVTSSTANGTYKVGDVIAVQVNFSENVIVTGTPQLTLETGATDRVVNYASGSGTSTLTFNYTVQAGDTSADLDYTGTGALALNSGTIKDAAGNNATLTLATPGAANSLGNNKNIVIDGVAPTVSGVTSSTANGTYKAGDVIAVQVNFSEAVTVTGTPQLTLETGTTDQVVNYASGSGTSTLTFNYTVQAGDTSADLDYTGTGALALNSGTIKDAAGNNATLTLATPGASNSLGANKNIVIDTTTPTVNGVTSSTANGTYKVGDVIAIQVNFSEAVTVTGTPQLTLETGTTDQVVNYASGSGTSTLTFNYTVQAGDTSADLDYTGTGALALNSGTIRDAAGNNATLTLAPPGAANSLGSNKAIVIDGVVPTVSSVNSSTANGSYKAGDTVSIQVNFSEAVTVTGTPQLTLETGTTDQVVNYASGSGTSTLTFTYTVQAGDTSADLDYQSTTALALNGGTIKDSAGNNATLTLATPGAANSLGANKAIVIDTTAPATTIATASFSADTGTSGSDFITNTAAQTISGTTSANMAAGEIVEVSTDNGSTWNTATTSVGANTWSLSGVTLTGSSTLKVRVTDTAGNSGTTLSQAYVLDTTAPTTTIASASFSADMGTSSSDFITNTAAQTISGTTSANMAAGEIVEVSTDNGSTWNAATTSVGANTWSLSGVTLTASDTLKVRVTDTAGNSGTILSQAYVLDTTASTVGSVNSSTANGTYKVGDTVSIQVNFGEAVTVTGTPQLTLETGTTDRAVSYASGSGTSTLTFTYTVQAGDTSADLDYQATTALALNGGTIKDGAGNNATLTLATPGAANSLGSNKAIVIDTTAPAAPSTPDMTAASDNGVSTTDNQTTITTPTFTGTAEALAMVKLFDGATQVGSAAADGSGNWSITSTALASGVHTITAVATDAAGNNSAASAGLAVTIAAPDLTGATYDAATGTLAIIGTGMVAGDTIDVSKLSLNGQGGAYALTSANVTTASTTSFTVTLNAADRLAVNGILNNNGTAAVDGTVFNLAAAGNWDQTASSAADLAGNGVTVSNVASPTIASATYDLATHVLTVTGSNLVQTLGAANDITVSKLALTGEGGITYVLTSDNIEAASATGFSVTLNTADQVQAAALFNKNGLASTGGTTYNLAAADDWNSVIGNTDTSVPTTPVTVSNVPVPAIVSSTYDAATGVLVVTGSGFTPLSGVANDIVASKFTFTGEGGATYTLTDTANAEITSGTSFTLTLSSADKAAVNLLVDNDGTASTGGTTYNLAAAEDWAAGADAALAVADLTGNAITVGSVVSLTSATYDAANGTLEVTGSGMAAGHTIDVGKLTLTGEGGAAYTLTSADATATGATGFSVTLNAADKLAVNGLLDQDGSAAVSGTPFNLAGAAGWDSTAGSPADTTGNAVTVSGVSAPTITSAAYDSDTHVLTVTGTDLVGSVGVDNDINVGKLTITGEGGATHTLATTGNVEVISATSFSITLSGADIAAMDTLLDTNGTSASDGTLYNLSAADDWNGVVTGANTADAINAITVSGNDADGIPGSEEDEVPPLGPSTVAGDGNGDGVPDSQQAPVTSASFLQTPQSQSNPGSAPATFVTLVADSLLGKVDTTDANSAQVTGLAQQDAPSTLPVSMNMPLGLFSFSVDVGTAGTPVTETFSLYVDKSLGINGFWTQDSSGTWVNLASAAYGGETVIEGDKLRLDFKLTDGGAFDRDGHVDGAISDLGTAAFLPLSLVGTVPVLPPDGHWL